MPEQFRLTYRELGDRLGLSADGARMLARRRLWPVAKGNDGRVIVTLSEAALAERSSRTSAVVRPHVPPNRELTAELGQLAQHLGELQVELTRAQAERDTARAVAVADVEAVKRVAESEAAAKDRVIDELRAERDLARADVNKLRREMDSLRERAGEVGPLREALADLSARLDRAEARLAVPWWKRLFG